MSKPKFTPGPWEPLNMVHADGRPMTPKELGKYVEASIKVRSECSDFLFVSATAADGERADVCHTGNGPDGPYNTALIAAAPELYEALETMERLAGQGSISDDPHRLKARAALARARGD